MHVALSARLLSCLIGVSVLGACATPAQRIDETARELGYTQQWVQGTDFLHLVYLKPGLGSEFHVYLEHDGLPWVVDDRIADDPTPRHPLMLRMMALDPAPTIYLGRPCYYGLATAPHCSPALWTNERYSERVVASMARALKSIIQRDPDAKLVFIGHSGGGTLAVLLAERFSETHAVVTLAGNLDITAWAGLHGYSPLIGSLNPATRPPLDTAIVQRHYVGMLDRNVPPVIARRYAASHPSTHVIELPGIDHDCCWEKLWPGMLADLAAARGRPSAHR